MAKFHQVQENEVVYPAMDGYKHACCGCNLVHKYYYQIVRVKDYNQPKELDEVVTDPELYIRLTAERDNRSTGQLRRQRKDKVK